MIHPENIGKFTEIRKIWRKYLTYKIRVKLQKVIELFYLEGLKNSLNLYVILFECIHY